MNSNVSDYISMDALARRPRVSRCQRARSASIRVSKPLPHIPEEEPVARSSSPSPMPSTSCNTPQTPALKARRRHCNLSPSEIQIARDFVGIGDEDDSSDREDRLMLVPPSSGRFTKGSSPVPSPDSFRLTFTDASYNFPHPPIPTPTSLNSRHIESFYGSSTPEASPASSEQPLTPSSSDDEFFALPSPKFNPRRAAIQPLIIRKHTSLSGSPICENDFLAPSKPTDSAQPGLSPFTSEESSSDSESDVESDSEWYHNELSKVLTVQARTPPASAGKARPDSIFISPPPKRFSRALHPSDSPFSPRRQSYRIPNYPPPPVPSQSRHRPISPLVPMSPTSPYSSRFSVSSRSPIRPPPRSSIPADFEFDQEDDTSSFSFTLYQHDEEDGSLKSAYSQPSYISSPSLLDEVEFDLDIDYPMMLPLSIPGTPVDLESDIAHGLEELRCRSAAAPSPLPSVPEDPQETMSISDFSFSPAPSVRAQPNPRSPSRNSFDSFYVYTPPMSPVNPLPPSPSPAAPARFTIEDEERVLKSKWSSSTLGSIREEHEKRISSRLRLFSPSKKHQRTSSKTAGIKIPQTPLSPMSFLTSSPSKKPQQQKPAVVVTPTPSPKKHSRQRSNDSMAVAYGQSGVGVKRRGSCTTVSDAGSEDSASSSSSSGLRRKPIPVELFLRK